MATPLDVDKYEQLLKLSNYNLEETKFLIKGFREGFDIGYTGYKIRQSQAKNIPFTVGNEVEMWNKIMKEVKLKRVAGPFDKIPFVNYIQSPIGLVPKAGNKTRLIFHLSYDFDKQPNSSVNGCTPVELCSVKYNDLDAAVQSCLEISQVAREVNGSQVVFLGKTDLTSAFRILCMNRASYCWLVFKATDPTDNKVKYFVDKCLLFGASISCSHYQRFSNSLKHILQHRTKTTQKKTITNYLDDFLFVVITKWLCNNLINQFLLLCQELRLPMAEDKTEWASELVVFLGILLDGRRLVLSLPIKKQQKALRLLNEITGKKKLTVKQLQVLTGYLNFLTKAIFPGRTFTRHIYAKYSNRNRQLKQHHHVSIDSEFHFDCEIWRFFLENYSETALCRPMVDINKWTSSTELMFY